MLNHYLITSNNTLLSAGLGTGCNTISIKEITTDENESPWMIMVVRGSTLTDKSSAYGSVHFLFSPSFPLYKRIAPASSQSDSDNVTVTFRSSQ